MSENQHSGGHELEGINPFPLAKALALGTVLAIAGVVAVVQLSYQQRNDLVEQSALAGSKLLETHQARVAGELKGIEAVSDKFAEDPGLLGRAQEPDGFVHPDQALGLAPMTKPKTPAPAAEAAEQTDKKADAKAAVDPVATKKPQAASK